MTKTSLVESPYDKTVDEIAERENGRPRNNNSWKVKDQEKEYNYTLLILFADRTNGRAYGTQTDDRRTQHMHCV